jgi:thioredoxin 1
MAVQHVQTLEEFETLLKENTFVAADFFADWCPPCKAIAPMFSNLASQKSIPGNLVFAKINVDNSPDISQKYGITAMPTFLFFEKGTPYSGRAMIRGADPRGIQTVVNDMAEAAATSKNAAEAAKTADGSTVSGGYTMSQESGKRSDWKMSLA